MNNQLTRIQVYLDPHDVIAVDAIARTLKIKRSQIIRDATKAVALRYVRTQQLLATHTKNANPLLSLVGIEKSKSSNVGINVDEIYSKD